jgi:hypothetical protein
MRRRRIPTVGATTSGATSVLSAFGLVLTALWAATVPAIAHDVPSDVRIQLFLRPEGQVLRLLVRAPLASMNDIPWPTAGLYLNLSDPEMPLALRDGARDWIRDRIDVYEERARLEAPRLSAVRVSLPSDHSFDAYGTALAALLGPPLPPGTELAKSQAMVDALLEYPIRSSSSRFSIDPHYRLLGLKATTALGFLGPDGRERTLEFHDDPGLVHLDPRWFQAATLFLGEGIRHIVGSLDHLLFLFSVAIPFRRFRLLAVVATAFTVAQAITLVASAYGLGPDAGWVPVLVDTLTAAAIFFAAIENIVHPVFRRRWLLAFGFGAMHGLGFAVFQRDTLQLGGSHLLTALLSYTAGLEIGQLAVMAVLVLALAALFRFGPPERIGTIVLSAIAAHESWHWMIDRGQLLWRYQFAPPDLNLLWFAAAVRWLMILVATSGAWWLLRMTKSRAASQPVESATHEA